MAKLQFLPVGAVALLSGFGLSQPAVAQSAADEDPAAILDQGPIAQIGIGAAYNTESGAVFTGFAKSDGVLQGGQELSLDARLAEDSGALTASYLSGQSGTLRYGVDVTGHRSAPTDTFAFATEAYEISPHLVIDLGPDAVLNPYLRYSVGHVTDVAAGASALIAGDAGTRRTTAAGISGQYLLGNDAGTAALQTSGGLEFGRSDLGNEYAKLSLELAVQGRVGAQEDVLLGATLAAGTIHSFDGATHIGDRQILGQSSLRGFAFGGFGPRDLAVGDTPALGGNTYTVLRLEAKYPKGEAEGTRAVPGLFADVGALWGLDSTAGGVAGASAVDDGFHLRASVGVSVDIDTDFGVLALSVAKPIQKMDYDEEAPFYMSFAKRF